MIAHISGKILSLRPDEVVVDVHGVGYRLQIPLSTFYRIGPPNGSADFFVHTHVREDAIQLFGFSSDDERQAFERLISISGVGPKIALAVLSGIGVSDLARAVEDADRTVLERIPGIGRKTAERVLLELKDRPPARGRKAGLAAPSGQARPASGIEADAASALAHLGYSDDASERAVAAGRREVGPEAPLEEVLRAALRSLVRGSGR
ncbi:MAG TPA: Holliday junction branch migration protein RuvA [Candidatus Polarisedimenticolaceae bacterium]|nr:Holliday junction branch migration protein RuvA [Candidatus Polarisedimenticolaceae bacterium]